MRVERSKLPKGMSYPLKSSVLETALRSAGIELDAHLIQHVSKRFFDAFFWPANVNVGHERLFIRASAVQSQEAEHARNFMNESVIPEFIAWVQSIAALPANSPIRREEQCFFRQLP